MKLDKILLELEMIEAELDDATNSLPEYGANSDSRVSIDIAKDSIYSLKHEIQETINVKKKRKSQWKDYKTFTLKDGTKFLARDEKDAELYRKKVGG